MFSMNKLKIAAAMLWGGVMLTACGGMTDDLNPSGADKRPSVTAGIVGNQPGQIAADFSMPTTDGGAFTLSNHLSGGSTPADAVVLYFTMWCPACAAHMDHIQFSIMPLFTDKTVRYVAVDYVNASMGSTITSMNEAGFGGGQFIVTGDLTKSAATFFNATMATTVVIDKNGVIRMNEDFRDGEKLKTALAAIPGG